MPRATRSALRAAEAAKETASEEVPPVKSQTQKRGRGKATAKDSTPKKEDFPEEPPSRSRRGATKEAPPPVEPPTRVGRGRRGKAVETEVHESGDSKDTAETETSAGRGTRGRKATPNVAQSPEKAEVKSRSRGRQNTREETATVAAEPMEPSPRGRNKRGQASKQSSQQKSKSPAESKTRDKIAASESEKSEDSQDKEDMEAVPAEMKVAKSHSPTKRKTSLEKSSPKKHTPVAASALSTDVEMKVDVPDVESKEQQPQENIPQADKPPEVKVKLDKQSSEQKAGACSSALSPSAVSPSGHKRKWSYPDDDIGMSPPKKRREVTNVSLAPTPATVVVQAGELEKKSTESELREYEVIQMSDVPAADSQEVAAAVPKLSQTEVESMETEESPTKMTSSQSVSVVVPPAPQTAQEKSPSQSSVVKSSMLNGSSNRFSIGDPLLSRTFIPNPHLEGSVDSSKKFSVVTYNILAECHRKRSDYSFTPEEYLDIEYRHKRMMEEFQFLDGDVLCLQEVDPDYYKDVLSVELSSLGYEGVFKKRNNDHYHEGEATFWRTNRFSLVDNKPILLQDILQKDVDALEQSEADKAAIRKCLEGPIVMLITRLKCLTTGAVLTVGNVHVIWGKLKMTDIQCMQCAAAVREVVNQAGGAHNPHIVCGDFNSFPDSCAYQLLQDGYLSDNSINKLQELTNVELSDHSKAALVNLLWKGFQHTSPHLKSAYASVQGKDPLVTSSNNLFTLCVDYIWGSLNDKLKLTGVTQAADIEHHIPTVVFPSDHISLKAEYAFV